MRTEWFDLDDQMFAHYDFNIGKLLLIIVTLPLLPYHITKMMLPDVDYWAQKSTQRLVHKEEHVKSNFYSIQVDSDQDGYVDSQINFESTDVDVYYEVNEFKKTILAAKYQDILTFIGEYVLRSICSLFTGSQEDVVFNEYLTEEHLETKDFSTSNLGAQMNAETLSTTYRKFTKSITTTYVDSFKYSTLTVIDYNEGEVEEHRIYKDDFKTSEGTSAEGFFEDLSNEHAITNIDTGAQSTVRFDPEIPYSHPANISWKGETWGSDNVPVKYDSLQVIGGDNSYSTNYFEKTIIIRIPNRYSLYNDFGKTSKSKVESDGWVEFEVEGVFITPEDGQVYYTSDVYAFKDDTAKIKGHYFYVDSDLNGFYETVYIISNIFTVSREGTPKYDVISIGLNYDGIHDFAPYEKLDQKVESISDFSNLAKESAMFGPDWVYNFNNLRHNELLIEKESIWDEFKPKDQIFEIYKLVDKSKNNPKFSELFYEIRHKTYSIAWEQYKKQLTGDVIEQVFMSVTASLLSAAVEALITASTLGFGWLGAKGMATLTYVAVYTLMTKFSIDRKLHEAESKTRSDTFYPASSSKVDPVSLNEKCIYDRILQDTMAAALLGHPGGYYQTVSGGEPGSTYTGHLVVSPPNLARVLNSFGGFLDLLWENIWNAGESDPDSYTALDFDDLNLDYLLMSSELPFYNTKLHYIYHNTEYIFDTYNMYSFNTLGALETQVLEGSGGQFDAIRPTCIDGAPQYEFINSTIYSTVLPQQILYRPVVLSDTRYNQIKPALGRLTVKVQCKDYGKTLGINPYDMNEIEQEVYEAKVPLNDNGFEYPIKYVFIDVVNFDMSNGFSYFAQDLIVNESYYAIDCGNLYFKKSIESIVSEKYSGFEDFLAQSWASELIESTIYYNIRVVFDRFVPDTTDETNSLALAQATSYAIMDYFNQYTYAEISSNMISEIAYTETLTFWSTLISAPLVYFGSWAVSAGVGKMFGEAGSKAVQAMLQKSVMGDLVGMVVSPIKEVFQEIIEDGFKEALIENLVSIAGGTDDLGFWLSSLSTSFREVKGALGQLTFGKTNLKNTFSLILAISSGDVDTRLEIEQKIAQDLKQRKEAEKAKQEQMSFWDKMLKTDFLKGLFMVIPSVFFGSFSFVALSGLNKMITSSIKLSPAAYAWYKTEQHVRAKKELNKMAKDQKSASIDSVLFNNMDKQAKKPTELDGEALNNIFRGLQDNELESPPLTIAFPQVNPNPKTESRNTLAGIFQSISFESYFKEQIEGYQSKGRIPKDIAIDSFNLKDSDVKINQINIGDDFEGLFPEHDKDTINYIHSKLFDPEYDQKKPKDVLGQINYRCSLISEARQILKSTKYYGLDILIDEVINPYVLSILQDKFNKGEDFTKLESIIADVASFYMGGPQIRHDGGYNQDTIREYEEETGKKAFLSNSPTKSFKDWFNARQTKEEMLEKIDGLVKSVVDDYMESLDKNKLQFRQLHFQDYVSDPSDVDKIYNNRKKYCWTGIVYRITELKEESGKIVEGRKLYGFTMNDLEFRWEWYKNVALDEDIENQRIHKAILAIKDKYGEHDIDNWFKKEVVEVHWEGGSLRDREREWIKKDNTQDPAIGFNTKPGGEGGRKIHIPIRLLAECIAKGLKISEIRNKLKNHGIYVSKNTLYDRIDERYGSFLDARKRFLKPVIKQLIIEGYKKQDIEECLETKTKSFLNSWMPKLFGGSSYTTVRQKYLLEMISTILETGLQDLTHGKIHSFLPTFGKYEIKHLIRNEWKSLNSAKLQFGREIAIYLFRKEKSDEYILKVLGYSEATISSQIDRAFKRLFNGMTADEAREHFTSGYKNIEGHFIWYSDLDNY